MVKIMFLEGENMNFEFMLICVYLMLKNVK